LTRKVNTSLSTYSNNFDDDKSDNENIDDDNNLNNVNSFTNATLKRVSSKFLSIVNKKEDHYQFFKIAFDKLPNPFQINFKIL